MISYDFEYKGYSVRFPDKTSMESVEAFAIEKDNKEIDTFFVDISYQEAIECAKSMIDNL